MNRNGPGGRGTEAAAAIEPMPYRFYDPGYGRAPSSFLKWPKALKEHDMQCDSTKPIVLAVDDAPENMDVLTGVLSETYRVKVALDGEKALRLANEQPRPDIILLDIMMPGMDGYEVCRRLKAKAATRGIPVIFVTSLNEIGDEALGLSPGGPWITSPSPLSRSCSRFGSETTLSSSVIKTTSRNWSGRGPGSWS